MSLEVAAERLQGTKCDTSLALLVLEQAVSTIFCSLLVGLRGKSASQTSSASGGRTLQAVRLSDPRYLEIQA